MAKLKKGGAVDVFAEAFEGAGYTLFLLLETIYHLRFIPKRKKEILEQLYLATFGSFGVIAIVAIFTGMILALQTGLVLQKYGQESSIGSIVAGGMARGMGPVMTAIAVAGIIGSTIATKIGTMKVSEEIDALEIMSIDPISYLVMPSVVAVAIVCPILTIYSNLIGIFGGGIIGSYIFGIDFYIYIDKIKDALELKDIYFSLSSSFIFGITIGVISCSQGLRAENGAEGVGKATLRSVVQSLVFILIFEYIITRIFY